MTIADELSILADTKERLRIKLGLSKNTPFSDYPSNLPYNPFEDFSAGENGWILDPSDLSTLFQDAAGTIPVTGDGDPVGLILDKSGNGNHAKQTVSTSRVVYRTNGFLHWLESDGVDDRMLITAANPISAPFLITTAINVESAGGFRFILSQANPDRLSLLLHSDGRLYTESNLGASYSNVLNTLVSNVLSLVSNSSQSKIQINNKAVSNVAITPSPISSLHLFSQSSGNNLIKSRFYGSVCIAGKTEVSAELKIYLAKKSGTVL